MNGREATRRLASLSDARALEHVLRLLQDPERLLVRLASIYGASSPRVEELIESVREKDPSRLPCPHITQLESSLNA